MSLIVILTILTNLAVADAGLISFKATYQAEARGHTLTGVQQLTEISPGTYEFSLKAQMK